MERELVRAGWQSTRPASRSAPEAAPSPVPERWDERRAEVLKSCSALLNARGTVNKCSSIVRRRTEMKISVRDVHELKATSAIGSAELDSFGPRPANPAPSPRRFSPQIARSVGVVSFVELPGSTLSCPPHRAEISRRYRPRTVCSFHLRRAGWRPDRTACAREPPVGTRRQ